MQNQKSALGMDGNVTALIGYIVGIIALVLIFIEKDNKFVRFHALQSVLWSAAATVAFIVVMIVGMVLGFAVAASGSSGLATIIGLLFMLVYLAVFFGWIGGLIFG